MDLISFVKMNLLLFFVSAVFGVSVKRECGSFESVISSKTRAEIPKDFYSKETKDISCKITLDDQYTTTIPLCLLQSARFQEQITIYKELNTTLYMDYSVMANECSGLVKPRSNQFKTIFQVESLELGPRPILQELPDYDTTTSVKQESKSFLAQYWYIILPVMILMMIPTEQPQRRR